MISPKRMAFFLLALTLVLLAAGCGPSMEETYFTNLAPAIEEYNASMDAVGTQFQVANSDSLNDQAWMDATFAALDRMDTAGQALASTPAEEVPENWVTLNDTLGEVSDQTSLFVGDMKAALEAQDQGAMLAALDEFGAIGPIFQKVLDQLQAQ